MKHIYAMTRQDGAVKVGISGDPRHRRFGVKAQVGQGVEISYKTEIRPDAKLIEGIAHRLLKEKHDHGEWFWITLDDAIAAISRAIDIAEGRIEDTTEGVWFSPKKIPGPTKKTERLTANLPAEFIHELDEWRRRQPDLPSRQEALRRTSLITLTEELGISTQ